MKLINYSIALNLIFFVNIKAEVIRAACTNGGQQVCALIALEKFLKLWKLKITDKVFLLKCYFSETCCSKKCIHRLKSKYFGGTCMEDKVELIEPGIYDENVNLCLPIGAKVRVIK